MEFTIEERVSRGAKLLDHHLPEWEREIDLEAFSITSLDHCIIAQLFASWKAGTRSMDLHDQYDQSMHGFDLTRDEYMSDWFDSIVSQIEEAWTDEINERMAA